MFCIVPKFKLEALQISLKKYIIFLKTLKIVLFFTKVNISITKSPTHGKRIKFRNSLEFFNCSQFSFEEFKNILDQRASELSDR